MPCSGWPYIKVSCFYYSTIAMNTKVVVTEILLLSASCPVPINFGMTSYSLCLRNDSLFCKTDLFSDFINRHIYPLFLIFSINPSKAVTPASLRFSSTDLSSTAARYPIHICNHGAGTCKSLKMISATLLVITTRR